MPIGKKIWLSPADDIMTPEQIDLLLLKYLDPTYNGIPEARLEEVQKRFEQLVADGYIHRTSVSEDWMRHPSVIGFAFMRTESGMRRLEALLGAERKNPRTR
jgi:hypothetical protein